MLRSAPRRFVDRETERDELIERASRARAKREQGVFVLQGIGGVGKTALMLWCVRELAQSFDLVLEVSMGASAEAKTVEEILDVFLLRLEARVTPPTFDGKLAVYRAETARRDVLVVLDDVDSAESVEQLVPASPAGVVLATSRQRLEAFEFAGFTTVPLDVLSEPRDRIAEPGAGPRSGCRGRTGVGGNREAGRVSAVGADDRGRATAVAAT